MKLQIPKKIRTEDFPSDQQDLISKLAYPINNAFDEVYQVLSGRVDFDNLSRKLVNINITLDSTGKMTSNPQIKLTDMISRLNGINVINAVNLINPATYPTSHPFISFNATTTTLTILNVTGLQAGSQYQLTLELL